LQLARFVAAVAGSFDGSVQFRVMGKTLTSLRRAVKAGVKAASQPIPKHKKYRVDGQRVLCSHCAGEIFEDAPVFTDMFVGPAIQCVRCSHIELFGKRALVEDAV
jgi:hypothetical protein